MSLPPIVAALSPEDRSAFRHRLGDAVEWLVALLDALDGDPDLEPEDDDNQDTGIADLDAWSDPDLCWTASGLAFDGTGTAIALASLATIPAAMGEIHDAA